MRTLVIAQPRSKSMWLNSMLASHYGYRNLKEPYGLTNEKSVMSDNIDNWVKNVFRITKELNDKDNVVVKLQTSSLYWKDKWFGLNSFNIESYDTIYTLRRQNRVDAICSMSLAQDLYKWHYLETPNTPIQSKTIDFKKDYQLLCDTVRDDLAMDKVQQLLPNSISLEYDMLDSWIADNLPNGASHLAESNYNYADWFANYASIQTYLDHVRETVCLK